MKRRSAIATAVKISIAQLLQVLSIVICKPQSSAAMAYAAQKTHGIDSGRAT